MNSELRSLLKYARMRAESKGWLNVLEAIGRKLRLPVSGIAAELSRAVCRREQRLSVVRIETMTGCNYRCPFCPTGRIDQAPARMSQSTFERLIDQLVDFTGSIHLFFRNEPLLDKRIESWVAMAATRTKARIVIQTNGSLLTPHRLEELSRYSRVIINDYKLEYTRTFQAASNNVVVVPRSFEEKLTNRAGNVPGSKIQHLTAFCSRPFRELTIAADGTAVLCCQDWMLQERVGNIETQSLAEIWTSPRLAKKRTELLAKTRTGLCSRCDYPGV